MWSIQSNVEFGYQLSICSGAKENHGKPWSSWPITGPSGCKLTSSQRTLASVPGCAVALLRYSWLHFYRFFIYVWISTKPWITSGGHRNNNNKNREGKKVMRCLLLLQLQWLCHTLQFHCFSVFRRIVELRQASVWPPQKWTFPGLWLPVNTWIVDTYKHTFCRFNVC
jgi:hypothetical protein